MKRKFSRTPGAAQRRRARRNENSWQRRFRLAKRYYGVARFNAIESRDPRFRAAADYWKRMINRLCEESGADIEACKRWRAVCERRRQQYVELERRSA